MNIASNILPKTVLLFLPFSSFNCLQTLSFPHPYLYGFALFISMVCTLGMKSFKAGVYSTVCRKEDYSISSQEPLKTWVGMHPGGDFLCFQVCSGCLHTTCTPSQSVQRFPGAQAVQYSLALSSTSAVSPAMLRTTILTAHVLPAASIRLCKMSAASLLDCCHCILAAKHLDNSAGSG